MRDVASGQEVATGREEIAQPEDLPVCDEKHALVRPPGLHTQPASAVAQQGTLYKCQQALFFLTFEPAFAFGLHAPLSLQEEASFAEEIGSGSRIAHFYVCYILW